MAPNRTADLPARLYDMPLAVARALMPMLLAAASAATVLLPTGCERSAPEPASNVVAADSDEAAAARVRQQEQEAQAAEAERNALGDRPPIN